MRRRVIRSWAVSAPVAALMAALVIASWRGFSGGAVGRHDWPTVVVSTILGVGGLAGIGLALRIGVAVSAAGITVRSFVPGRRIPRDRIEEVTCEQVGYRARRPSYAPVVRLASGERVRLLTLATARWGAAQRRTDVIVAVLGRAPF